MALDGLHTTADASEGGTWESLPIEIRAMILKSVSPRERLREINENTVVQLNGGLSCGRCSRCCCSWGLYVEGVCYMSSQDWATGVARSWSGARIVNTRIMWKTIKLYADILMGDFPSCRVGTARLCQSMHALLDVNDVNDGDDADDALQARYEAFMSPRLPCLLEYVDVVCTIPVSCNAMATFRARHEASFGRLFGTAWGIAGRSELWNVHHYTAPHLHA